MGNAAAGWGSPVRARYPNATPSVGFIWPLYGVVAADCSRSTQTNRPGCQLSVDQGMVTVFICVTITAFLSPAIQCAGENVIGPAQGY